MAKNVIKVKGSKLAPAIRKVEYATNYMKNASDAAKKANNLPTPKDFGHAKLSKIQISIDKIKNNKLPNFMSNLKKTSQDIIRMNTNPGTRNTNLKLEDWGHVKGSKAGRDPYASYVDFDKSKADKIVDDYYADVRVYYPFKSITDKKYRDYWNKGTGKLTDYEKKELEKYKNNPNYNIDPKILRKAAANYRKKAQTQTMFNGVLTSLTFGLYHRVDSEQTAYWNNVIKELDYKESGLNKDYKNINNITDKMNKIANKKNLSQKDIDEYKRLEKQREKLIEQAQDKETKLKKNGKYINLDKASHNQKKYETAMDVVTLATGPEEVVFAGAKILGKGIKIAEVGSKTLKVVKGSKVVKATTKVGGKIKEAKPIQAISDGVKQDIKKSGELTPTKTTTEVDKATTAKPKSKLVTKDNVRVNRVVDDETGFEKVVTTDKKTGNVIREDNLGKMFEPSAGKSETNKLKIESPSKATARGQSNGNSESKMETPTTSGTSEIETQKNQNPNVKKSITTETVKVERGKTPVKPQNSSTNNLVSTKNGIVKVRKATPKGGTSGTTKTVRIPETPSATPRHKIVSDDRLVSTEEGIVKVKTPSSNRNGRIIKIPNFRAASIGEEAFLFERAVGKNDGFLDLKKSMGKTVKNDPNGVADNFAESNVKTPKSDAKSPKTPESNGATPTTPKPKEEPKIPKSDAKSPKTPESNGATPEPKEEPKTPKAAEQPKPTENTTPDTTLSKLDKLEEELKEKFTELYKKNDKKTAEYYKKTTELNGKSPKAVAGSDLTEEILQNVDNEIKTALDQMKKRINKSINEMKKPSESDIKILEERLTKIDSELGKTSKRADDLLAEKDNLVSEKERLSKQKENLEKQQRNYESSERSKNESFEELESRKEELFSEKEKLRSYIEKTVKSPEKTFVVSKEDIPAVKKLLKIDKDIPADELSKNLQEKYLDVSKDLQKLQGEFLEPRLLAGKIETVNKSYDDVLEKLTKVEDELRNAQKNQRELINNRYEIKKILTENPKSRDTSAFHKNPKFNSNSSTSNIISDSSKQFGRDGEQLRLEVTNGEKTDTAPTFKKENEPFPEAAQDTAPNPTSSTNLSEEELQDALKDADSRLIEEHGMRYKDAYSGIKSGEIKDPEIIKDVNNMSKQLDEYLEKIGEKRDIEIFETKQKNNDLPKAKESDGIEDTTRNDINYSDNDLTDDEFQKKLDKLFDESPDLPKEEPKTPKAAQDTAPNSTSSTNLSEEELQNALKDADSRLIEEHGMPYKDAYSGIKSGEIKDPEIIKDVNNMSKQLDEYLEKIGEKRDIEIFETKQKNNDLPKEEPKTPKATQDTAPNPTSSTNLSEEAPNIKKEKPEFSEAKQADLPDENKVIEDNINKAQDDFKSNHEGMSYEDAYKGIESGKITDPEIIKDVNKITNQVKDYGSKVGREVNLKTFEQEVKNSDLPEEFRDVDFEDVLPEDVEYHGDAHELSSEDFNGLKKEIRKIKREQFKEDPIGTIKSDVKVTKDKVQAKAKAIKEDPKGTIKSDVKVAREKAGEIKDNAKERLKENPVVQKVTDSELYKNHPKAVKRTAAGVAVGAPAGAAIGVTTLKNNHDSKPVKDDSENQEYNDDLKDTKPENETPSNLDNMIDEASLELENIFGEDNEDLLNEYLDKINNATTEEEINEILEEARNLDTDYVDDVYDSSIDYNEDYSGGGGSSNHNSCESSKPKPKSKDDKPKNPKSVEEPEVINIPEEEVPNIPEEPVEPTPNEETIPSDNVLPNPSETVVPGVQAGMSNGTFWIDSEGEIYKSARNNVRENYVGHINWDKFKKVIDENGNVSFEAKDGITNVNLNNLDDVLATEEIEDLSIYFE